MTENEALNTLHILLAHEKAIDAGEIVSPNNLHSQEKEALQFILEEIQQYRELGTVEELKTFKDGFAVDFANMGYEKGLRDGYSKAKAYYKEQMKGGE